MVKQSKDAPAKPNKALVEIVDNVKQFRRMCQSVIDLADAVHDVDTLERAAREAENRMAEKADQERSLNQQIQVTSSTLEVLQKDIATAKDDAKAIVSKAKNEAQTIVAQAKEKARGVEADAETEWNRTKQESKQLQSDAKALADEMIADANEEVKKLDEQIASKQGDLNGVEVQIVAKTAELAGLQKQIDDLKAKASSILA